jgi:hemerythrin-like domain-containing protein
MEATRKEIWDLLRQHEAIRAHMKFLARTLKKLTVQSHRGTPADLKDYITLYRWSLYDFREAIKRHIEMDDRIFASLLTGNMSAEMDLGHEDITRRIDAVIELAENAVYHELNRQEINRSAADIKLAVRTLCDTCQAHIAREDAILETALEEKPLTSKI